MSDGNKPVRSRDEQIEALAKAIGPEKVFPLLNEEYRQEIRERAQHHIEEAEARGAAEQRRKDGEGQEPVAWCLVTSDQQIINGIHVEKCHAEGWKHRRASDTLTPLYTHPANVAALEDRVRVLEEALLAIVETAEADFIVGLGPYLRIARAALTREGGV